MYTAISGQVAVAKQIDLIANNIANVNTTGFKAERPLFEQVLTEQKGLLTSSLRKDVRAPSPFATDEFAAMKASYADFSQGVTETTGNPLDVAIQGKGFFVIQTPNGERYTRAGNFRLDSTNKLITQDGHSVQGAGGEITAGPGQLTVENDGTIKVNNSSVGKFRIVDLDFTKVDRESGQIFSLREGGPTDLEQVSVAGGALEGSNVNAVRELADMILASRLFEGFKSVQESSSKMNQARNEKLGSTQG